MLIIRAYYAEKCSSKWILNVINNMLSTDITVFTCRNRTCYSWFVGNRLWANRTSLEAFRFSFVEANSTKLIKIIKKLKINKIHYSWKMLHHSCDFLLPCIWMDKKSFINSEKSRWFCNHVRNSFYNYYFLQHWTRCLKI